MNIATDETWATQTGVFAGLFPKKFSVYQNTKKVDHGCLGMTSQ